MFNKFILNSRLSFMTFLFMHFQSASMRVYGCDLWHFSSAHAAATDISCASYHFSIKDSIICHWRYLRSFQSLGKLFSSAFQKFINPSLQKKNNKKINNSDARMKCALKFRKRIICPFKTKTKFITGLNCQ